MVSSAGKVVTTGKYSCDYFVAEQTPFFFPLVSQLQRIINHHRLLAALFPTHIIHEIHKRFLECVLFSILSERLRGIITSVLQMTNLRHRRPRALIVVLYFISSTWQIWDSHPRWLDPLASDHTLHHSVAQPC